MSTEASSRAARGPEKERSYSLANKLGRILLLALEEAAGSESTRTILSAARMQDRMGDYPPNDFTMAFSFEELGRIQQAIEELYGPGTGRRLARQVGRKCFRKGAEDLRPVLGVADLLFRVLPLRVRFRFGFEVLAQMFNRFSDQVVSLEEDDQYFSWVSERCAVCWGRHTDDPCCDLLVGLLEEGVYWLSGGAKFFIEESSCIAAGDPTCTVLIGKKPLAHSAAQEESQAHA
jgi:hypothetical protein